MLTTLQGKRILPKAHAEATRKTLHQVPQEGGMPSVLNNQHPWAME